MKKQFNIKTQTFKIIKDIEKPSKVVEIEFKC